MKIIVIGGNGTIGKAIVKELSPRHEVIVAARHHADIEVDINDTASIKKMYETVKNIDAIVAVAGQVHFGALIDMNEDKHYIGIKSKLMGQVNLVQLGINYLNDEGSFTLTTGILNRDPIRFGASAALVDAAIEGYVVSAALEMPRRQRINVVSPTIIEESLEHYGEYFRGYTAVPAVRAALAYSKSIEGAQTGQIYCVN